MKDGNEPPTKYFVLTVFAICFGSSFVIGYNFGVMNLPNEFIKNFLADTIFRPTPTSSAITNKIVTPAFLYGQLNAFFVILGAVGSFCCGSLADKLGRRYGLLLNHAFIIIGAILCGPCVKVNSAAMLFLGRAFCGLNCGFSLGIAPMYLTEISPRSKRGIIGSLHQLALTIGIVFSYLMTTTHIFNKLELWPVAIALSCIPAVICIFILPFCPESPRYLYMKKNQVAEAREAFIKLNASEDVNEFLNELDEEIKEASLQPKFSFKKLFTDSKLRMPILIACFIQMLQQLSGINAVINYSSTMFKTAGIQEDAIQWSVVGIGVLNVVVTVVALFVIEKLGRRTLLLWPTVVLAISLLVLTISVRLAQTLKDEASKAAGITSIVFILLYVVGFAIGLGPIPGFVVAEVFQQGPRAAAYSLSQGINWLCNLLVQSSYPSIDEAIGGFSFLPFLIIVVIFWIFFFLFMPETRNRPFIEVARELERPRVVVCQRRFGDHNIYGEGVIEHF